MVSSIECEKTRSALNPTQIQDFIENLAQEFNAHWKRRNLDLTWDEAIKGDDSLAYWLQRGFNSFVSWYCKTEEDERNLRFTLAKKYLTNYLSNPCFTPNIPDWDDKTRRCALWRWMVCMGRHTEEDRMNSKTVASLTEAQIYCRSMVQCLNLNWTEDQINRAAMSYVELNQRG